MNHLKKTVPLALLSALLFSCVSSKKFEAANTQISTLNSQVESLNQKVATGEKEISKLKTENIQYGKVAEDCHKAKAAIAQRLDNLNHALTEKGTSLHQIHEKIEISLAKFKNAGIDVEYKDGLVHLHMPNDLVFNSGSTTIGWEGKQALAIISEVVNEYPGVSLYVVGNTDNVPYQSGTKDNWSLSTDRANAVTRVLIKDGKVDASRIISGGQASFHPVSDNATSDGKWQNRRTDIIINPNLERLLDMPSMKP